MTAIAPHQDAPARRHRRVPWSPRAWSQALYLTGSIPALLAMPLIIALPWYAVGSPTAALVFFGQLLAVLALALLAAPLLTRLHRSRLLATAEAIKSNNSSASKGLRR